VMLLKMSSRCWVPSPIFRAMSSMPNDLLCTLDDCDALEGARDDARLEGKSSAKGCRMPRGRIGLAMIGRDV
jgi:hypothetical protein